mmetsp:Transcript_25974/g.34785  ORF Transcript_25974/g.34785 Transcript_25974/m.34785 type:complete len:204 (-) Transcript_25974:61-672(-)
MLNTVRVACSSRCCYCCLSHRMQIKSVCLPIHCLIDSLLGGFAELVEEVSGELVLTLLQFLLGHAGLLEDGDVEGELLALEQVRVEEASNLVGVLPRPRAQDSGSVHGVLPHVVVEEGVEVQVRHATHLTLQSAHLQLSLVVHLSDQLLTVLQLHLELLLLLAVQVRALILKVGLVVLAMDVAGGIGRVHEALTLLIVDELVV